MFASLKLTEDGGLWLNPGRAAGNGRVMVVDGRWPNIHIGKRLKLRVAIFVLKPVALDKGKRKNVENAFRILRVPQSTIFCELFAQLQQPGIIFTGG